MENTRLREELRSWLEANWRGGGGPIIHKMWETDAATRKWLKQVYDAGWAVPGWPKEWSGRDFADEQVNMVVEEFARVGAPGAGQDRSNLPANTLLTFGSDALKRALLPGLLKGEINVCLLYSEPAAGSDLAAVRTRAEPDGDRFVVNGQKVWTSGAATADFGMLVARTDWNRPKHKGLSFFLFPMKQPGVEVRPLRQITGVSQFNEVFITNAYVPADHLLGKVNEGWRVLQTALAYERSVMGDNVRRSRHGIVDDLIGLAEKTGKLDDPLVRQELAQVIALRKLNGLNNARAKMELEQGTSSPVLSLGKLAMSRILHEEARVGTMLVGVASLLAGDEYPEADDVNFLALNAYFTSIGGGTDQIQKNIISERILGLPKEQEIDRDMPFKDVRSGP